MKRKKSKVGINNGYILHKWANLLVFGLMYITMYLGRYNFNTSLPQIAADLGISAGVETLLYASVYFAYAVGCFVNGYLADIHNPKTLVVLGAVGSIAANVLMLFMPSWQSMLAVSLLNGYAQSMVWVSGIAIIVQWWRSEERGIAVGIANLCSSISYIVLLAVPVFTLPGTIETWREDILYPLFFVSYFTVIFCAVTKARPEDVGYRHYVEREDVQIEEEVLASSVPKSYRSVLKYFFRSRMLWCWCAIGFLSSLCRYGLLSKVPEYYEGEESAVYFNLLQSNIWISIGMALGTLIIAYVAGRYYNKNKGSIVVICAGICAAIVVVFPMLESPTMAMIGMFFTGFFLFGINGLLWLYAMDAGTRIYAATVTGILNGFAYLGATFENQIFYSLLSLTGDWISVFVFVEIMCVAIILFGCMITRMEVAQKEVPPMY